MRSVKICGAFGRYRGARAYRFIAGDLSERSHLEELDIDKVKLLNMIFERQNRARKWTGLI
jgi:hypothetical protein